MTKGTVIVTIKNGKATIKPTGFPGRQCLKVTADLEAALGRTVSSIPTGEMREAPITLRAGTS